MLIRAENLYKVYRNGKQSLGVLKGIALSFKKGELVAIIGPSGAGKSTLLHILGGLDAPSNGRVFLNGIDLYASTDRRRSLIRNRQMGFVFQFYHLLPEFSAIDNVMMPALISSQARLAKENSSCLKSGCRHRAEELLSLVGLDGRIDHRPSELSGGEAQRVAIARALINEPDIVFCDEPTGNLDSGSSEIVFELIKRLNREKNQTFLIVTHNERLADFANRVIHIKDGALI